LPAELEHVDEEDERSHVTSIIEEDLEEDDFSENLSDDSRKRGESVTPGK
jgi:hypothetical protein